MELAVRQLLVLYPGKIIDFNQGRIVRLLAAKRGVCCQFLEFDQVLPDVYKQVYVERANQICAGRIQVLNNEIEVSDGIDWDKDYLSRFVWPKGKYFRKYVQVDLTNDADVKIPRKSAVFTLPWPWGLPTDILMLKIIIFISVDLFSVGSKRILYAQH